MRHTVQILPPHQYYYRDDEGNLQVGTYDVNLLREHKLQAVKDWNESQQITTIDYAGHKFDFDPTSVQRVMAVVMSGFGSPTGAWTTADNVDVPADAAFMQGLYVAMVTHVAVTHSKQRKMKNDLLVMVDPAEIAGYEVP